MLVSEGRADAACASEARERASDQVVQVFVMLRLRYLCEVGDDPSCWLLFDAWGVDVYFCMVLIRPTSSTGRFCAWECTRCEVARCVSASRGLNLKSDWSLKMFCK